LFPLDEDLIHLPAHLSGSSLENHAFVRRPSSEANYDYTYVRIWADNGQYGTGECFFAPGLSAALRRYLPLVELAATHVRLTAPPGFCGAKARAQGAVAGVSVQRRQRN